MSEKENVTPKHTGYEVINVEPRFNYDEQRAACEKIERRLFEIFAKYIPPTGTIRQ